MLCMSDRLGCSVSIPCCFGSRPLSCGPFPVLGVAGVRWNGPVTLTPATSPGNEDGGKGANKKEDGSAAVSISSPHSPSTFFSPLLPESQENGEGMHRRKRLSPRDLFRRNLCSVYQCQSNFVFKRGCCTQRKNPPSDFSMPMGQIRG